MAGEEPPCQTKQQEHPSTEDKQRSPQELAQDLFAPHLQSDKASLRRVYLKLAMQHHPDKVPTAQRAYATQLFQAIVAVYEKITKPGMTMVKRERSPVAAAASLGDVEELRRLLEQLPSRANEIDSVGVSPLMLAAKVGSVGAAEILIRFGADLHALTPIKWSAVAFAGMNNEASMVKFLVRQGASVSDNDLVLVVYTGNDSSLESLLECFQGNVPDITTNKSGWTLLHLLCEGMLQLGNSYPERFSRSLNLLLKYGIPIDAIEAKHARTSLQHYVGHSIWLEEQLETSSVHLRFLEQLCLCSASPTRKDSEGNSALELACSAGLHKVHAVLQTFSHQEPLPSARL